MQEEEDTETIIETDYQNMQLINGPILKPFEAIFWQLHEMLSQNWGFLQNCKEPEVFAFSVITFKRIKI